MTGKIANLLDGLAVLPSPFHVDLRNCWQFFTTTRCWQRKRERHLQVHDQGTRFSRADPLDPSTPESPESPLSCLTQVLFFQELPNVASSVNENLLFPRPRGIQITYGTHRDPPRSEHKRKSSATEQKGEKKATRETNGVLKLKEASESDPSERKTPGRSNNGPRLNMKLESGEKDVCSKYLITRKAFESVCSPRCGSRWLWKGLRLWCAHSEQ
jgi:hypothetical protein